MIYCSRVVNTKCQKFSRSSKSWIIETDINEYMDLNVILSVCIDHEIEYNSKPVFYDFDYLNITLIYAILVTQII